MSSSKTSFFSFLLIALCLMACQGNQKQTAETTTAPPPPYVLELEDKGLVTLQIDQESDFQRLQGLNSFEQQGQQYLSFYSHGNRSIYVYDLDSLQLVQKTPLASDGPNQVNVMFLPDFLVHRLDSIFINTTSSGLCLVNTEGTVLGKAGKQSRGFASIDRRLRIRGAGYFKDNRLYGPLFAGFYASLDVHEIAFGSFALGEEKLQAEAVHSRVYFEDFDKMMTIRRDAKKAKASLIPIMKHFAAKNDLMAATTAISDSVRIFKNLQLQETLYMGKAGTALAGMEEYMYYRQMTQKPGEVGAQVEVRQKPSFVKMMISPDGQFLYRILINETQPGFVPNLEKDMPQVSSATLIALNLSTQDIAYIDLPVNEVVISVPLMVDAIASNQGVLFRVKEQENEDEVQFRVFGPQSYGDN